MPQPPSRLRLRRWLLGLSIDEVAHEAGLDRSHVSRIERGIHAGSPGYVDRIERVLEHHEARSPHASLPKMRP
jgi:transcriptional regulator with XRE-family HTH domain